MISRFAPRRIRASSGDAPLIADYAITDYCRHAISVLSRQPPLHFIDITDERFALFVTPLRLSPLIFG